MGQESGHGLTEFSSSGCFTSLWSGCWLVLRSHLKTQMGEAALPTSLMWMLQDSIAQLLRDCWTGDLSSLLVVGQRLPSILCHMDHFTTWKLAPISKKSKEGWTREKLESLELSFRSDISSFFQGEASSHLKGRVSQGQGYQEAGLLGATLEPVYHPGEVSYGKRKRWVKTRRDEPAWRVGKKQVAREEPTVHRRMYWVVTAGGGDSK